MLKLTQFVFDFRKELVEISQTKTFAPRQFWSYYSYLDLFFFYKNPWQFELIAEIKYNRACANL